MEGQLLEIGGRNTAVTYDAKHVCKKIGFFLSWMLLLGSLLQWLWPKVIGDRFPESLDIWLGNFVPLHMIAIPVTMALLLRIKGRTPEKHEMSFKWLSANFVVAWGTMIVGNWIGTNLMGLLPSGNAPTVVSSYVVDENEAMKLLFLVVLGPLMEEIIFRKLLIDRTRAFGEKNAIVFSALLFGLFHMNVVQSIYTFGMGLVLGYVYVRTGKLGYAWVMHAVLNFFGLVLLGWLGQHDVRLVALYIRMQYVVVFMAVCILFLEWEKWKPVLEAKGDSKKALWRDMLLNTGMIGFYVVSIALEILVMFPEFFLASFAK